MYLRHVHNYDYHISLWSAFNTSSHILQWRHMSVMASHITGNSTFCWKASSHWQQKATKFCITCPLWWESPDEHWIHMWNQAPVPLSIFRSTSKFDENSKHSSVKYTRPITTIFCTLHDSVTVVTCAKYRCDRSSIFETRAFWIFIEFRIRSKYP